MKLQYAIRANDFNKVKNLVESKVDLDFKVFNKTPLSVAIYNKCFPIACYLVEKGASLEIREDSQFKLTPLHLASKSGSVILVETMLNLRKDLINVRDASGMSALHWAVMKNHTKVAKILMNNGADINSKTNKGITPLYLSVLNGHLACVECLLKLGVDVNLQTDEGYTPLMRACSNTHYNIHIQFPIENLIQRRREIDQLNTHSYNGVVNYIFHPSSISKCISDLSDFNYVQKNIVKKLLDHGAEIDSKEDNSPLKISINCKQYHITTILVNACCTITEKDVEILNKIGIFEDKSFSLLKICKKTIRKTVGKFIDEKICQLPLPPLLKTFLQIY